MCLNAPIVSKYEIFKSKPLLQIPEVIALGKKDAVFLKLFVHTSKLVNIFSESFFPITGRILKDHFENIAFQPFNFLLKDFEEVVVELVINCKPLLSESAFNMEQTASRPHFKCFLSFQRDLAHCFLSSGILSQVPDLRFVALRELHSYTL